MAKNGDSPHVCIQSARLTRLESELAQIEARRRADIDDTIKTFKGLTDQFNSAIEHITDASAHLVTTRKQIHMLFAMVRRLKPR